MSDTIQGDLNEMVEQMNEAVAESIEQNMEAQATLFESWAEAIDDSIPEEDVIAEGIEGYNNAYEVWIDASEEMLEQTTMMLEGEDFQPDEFRDIWLASANEAFKEVMSTSAFAAANGQFVEEMLDVQQEIDATTQDTLAQAGMATQEDVSEVAERLVELELRQHDVEQKLDRVLDALEE